MIGTIAVSAVLVLVVASIVAKMIINKKNGKSSCGCSGSCSGCSACHTD